ncbi:MAG: hypothetical protein AAGI45_20370, partial [Cyanobacteria bacterium P01_H01_bin.26]
MFAKSPTALSVSQENNPAHTKSVDYPSSFSKAWAVRYMRTVNQPLPSPTFKNELELRAAVAKTLHQALRT